jgi:NAD(P)H-nitrite reductase large subunit
MIICRCNEVSLAEIRAIQKKNHGATLLQIIEHTGASTKCGRCRPLLEKTHNKLIAQYPRGEQMTLPFKYNSFY